MKSTSGNRSMLVLTLADLRHDSRVRRVCAAMVEAGWQVTLLGPEGGTPPPNLNRFIPIEIALGNGWRSPFGDAAASVISKISTAFAILACGAHPDRALLHYRRRARFLEPARAALGEIGRHDVVYANDWDTLPLAIEAADGLARVVYDSHEFAAEEFSENLLWKLFERPMRLGIERAFVPNLRAVITVSPSIAKQLQIIYGLESTPLVVRNIPNQQPIIVPDDGASKVLYLGAIKPHRGLEALVDSMRWWRSDQSFTLIGPGHSSIFATALFERARTSGVADRLAILPPVAPESVVATARRFDIGAIVLPTRSSQQRFALPNKVFEYLCAGLVLVTSDHLEMARVVRESGAGAVTTSMRPKALGRQIAAIDLRAAAYYKAAALRYAKANNWPSEVAPLLNILESLEKENS